MSIFTIVRHAEAEGNFYRRAHGHYDSLLTPNGEAQVAALRRRFMGTRFDAVYASDLFRARRTAAALIRRERHVKLMPALRELHLGPWEDVPWGEWAARDPESLWVFMHEPWRFAPQGAVGEPMAAVGGRMCEALRLLARTHPDDEVAVVSHGLAIRALMAALSGLPPERVHELPHGDNTSVSRVEWDGVGRPRVFFYGDNTHLGNLSTLGRQNWWRKDSLQADTNLWFQSVRLPEDAALALSFRRQAWQAVYGTMLGFSDALMGANTARMAALHPAAVTFAMRGWEPVGLVELDPAEVCRGGGGHISLVYLAPEARGLGLGAQLIGHAVSVYRGLGRRTLHLRVAEANHAARRLYEKTGFRVSAYERGLHGVLLVMTQSIAVN
ncbi:MAG: GNAT family N-acetyltransferase [Oscillospiraceae bacterium]|jgi:probable phosphoglycerate mutase|nr:GNAT family N-acetyltransferase [Oscillospiraceae bacterium]